MVQRHLDGLNPDRFHFLPLGGSGEIGMNLNLYHHQGKWLIVDLGISFTDFPGLDIVTPDVSILAPYKEDLAGIIITHAHEDHVGAVGYLWDRLGCPIFATPFTAAVIRQKLRETPFEAKIHEVPLSGSRDIGPFSVQFVNMAHSIPESSALVIRTKVGTLFHTGDWKIDPDPVEGQLTDEKALQKLGNEGVLAVVCDSTNVFEDEQAGSESEVRKNLIDLVGSFTQERVVVTCFASNVARLSACAKAAEMHGRTPIIIGRSLSRMVEAAKSCGYLKDAHFLDETHASKIDRNKTLWICTGSQGEVGSALARIAQGRHRGAALEAGDVVIFSSRIIPGNDRKVYAVQNALIRQGVKVIGQHDPDGVIHVSGHASRPQIAQLYQWLKPKIVVTVHGEMRHMMAHENLARQQGVAHVIVPNNGSLIEMQETGYGKIIREVPVKTLALDGRAGLIPLDGDVVKERTLMVEAGCIHVTLSVGSQKRLRKVIISLWGIIEGNSQEKREFAEKIKRHVTGTFNQVKEDFDMQSHEDAPRIEQKITQSIVRWFREFHKKVPLVNTHVVM